MRFFLKLEMRFLGAKRVIPDGNFNKFTIVKKYPIAKIKCKISRYFKRNNLFHAYFLLMSMN